MPNPNDKFTKVLKKLLSLNTSEQRKGFLVNEITKQASNLAASKKKSMISTLKGLLDNKE